MNFPSSVMELISLFKIPGQSSIYLRTFRTGTSSITGGTSMQLRIVMLMMRKREESWIETEIIFSMAKILSAKR